MDLGRVAFERALPSNCAVSYLTKEEQQAMVSGQGKNKAITKGELPDQKENTGGRPRLYLG